MGRRSLYEEKQPQFPLKKKLIRLVKCSFNCVEIFCTFSPNQLTLSEADHPKREPKKSTPSAFFLPFFNSIFVLLICGFSTIIVQDLFHSVGLHQERAYTYAGSVCYVPNAYTNSIVFCLCIMIIIMHSSSTPRFDKANGTPVL